MKVILQQDVKGQGKKGQMIEASDGYARNFLLPRKLAVLATAENINTMKMQEKAKKAQEAAEKAEAEATAAKLKELSVKVVAKAGNGGRLFGAVTTKEIADALSAQHGITIQKTKIVQDEPIKAFGTYELKVKLGYEVTGTLTIKADGKTLMVLTLTGMVGDPKITTTEIPEAVKYVPYGTMIQNSNKYSWIETEYFLTDGELPAGIQLKPNGELYGVPQETGTYTFTVMATFNSTREAYYFPESEATLTLTVKENTNANVYNETDAGYTLSTPIGMETTPGSYDFYLAEIADSLFVSEGTFNEFIDLWLNGQKLVKGVDYTAESGSTRITISAQTLQNKAAQSGNNTIAAEFRVDGDINKDLRRTAQNFRLDNAGNGNSGGGSSSGGSGSSSAARGVTISGYLVDANNAPLSGMTVELHSTPRTTVTDADGFFQFRDVEFGWHNLYVKDGNGNLLASRGFELREDRAVTLSGDVVTAPAGSPDSER